MQGQSVFFPDCRYDSVMPAGRPAKFKRTPFGERLYAARLHAGLSQVQVADRLKIRQPSYAAWERQAISLRPEFIPQLASLLNVSVEHLLGCDSKPNRQSGPIGKARAIFEEVSKLPRHQQQHILRYVEDMLRLHRLNGHVSVR
jgi:transcriptional regulator with XRE-family HTH domain